MQSVFAERVHWGLEPTLAGPLLTWAATAAGVFQSQLLEAGAAPHSELAQPIADWLAMPSREQQAIGLALDVLQVAFDLADNLADGEEDERRGRCRLGGYRDVPLSVLTCLPAYFVATAHQLLDTAFTHRPEALRHANQQIHGILGNMLLGQACERATEKARLVSGAQARLLCLPVWLSGSHPLLTAECRAQVEAWAVAWGTSWELGFMARELGTASARGAWIASIEKARAVWPTFGPFQPQQPMGSDRLLPGLC